MSVEAKTIEAVKEILQTHAVIDEFVFYIKIKKCAVNIVISYEHDLQLS
ncbi:hypothetical protein ACIQ1D_06685 [Lysinibacillus xylanilyticus]